MPEQSTQRGRSPVTRQVIAWALYDWGNSAFALSVMAVLYPLFLGSFWSAGDDGSAVTVRLAWVTGAGSLVVAVSAPLLGTIADVGGYKKRLLTVFALLGAIMTAALSLVDEGGWPLALGLYLFASVGFHCANVFYDSLIVDVSKPRHYHLVSAYGFALGYFGGAALLAVHVWMMLSPATFGFADVTAVIRFAFVSVGIWWILFLLPLLWVVPENRPPQSRVGETWQAGYRQLAETFREIRKYKNILLFLIAYWLYIDGVLTVISMAVNFGQRLGFGSEDLVKALMITNFVAFPATLGFGWLGHRFGPRRAIYVCLAVYIGVAFWAMFLREVSQFYIMAITIGLVQGGVQSMSRSLYATLIPTDKAGEFFGFYNMLGKFAAVLGPILVGLVAMSSEEPKYMLIVLIPLFVIGAGLLSRVRTDVPATS